MYYGASYVSSVQKELIDNNNKQIGYVTRYVQGTEAIAYSLTIISPNNEAGTICLDSIKPIVFEEGKKPVKFISGLSYYVSPRGIFEYNGTGELTRPLTNLEYLEWKYNEFH